MALTRNEHVVDAFMKGEVAQNVPKHFRITFFKRDNGVEVLSSYNMPIAVRCKAADGIRTVMLMVTDGAPSVTTARHISEMRQSFARYGHGVPVEFSHDYMDNSLAEHGYDSDLGYKLKMTTAIGWLCLVTEASDILKRVKSARSRKDEYIQAAYSKLQEAEKLRELFQIPDVVKLDPSIDYAGLERALESLEAMRKIAS